jgi:hypothetical protein
VVVGVADRVPGDQRRTNDRTWCQRGAVAGRTTTYWDDLR